MIKAITGVVDLRSTEHGADTASEIRTVFVTQGLDESFRKYLQYPEEQSDVEHIP
jgi:hypothetical protein